MTDGPPSPGLPGTYALVLVCRQPSPVRIGKLSVLQAQAGFYVYVGSAFGSGGLSARLRHHLKISSRPHWHIDYLRAVCSVVEVWFTTETALYEHTWASAVARLPGANTPLPHFGSSDCACESHLSHFHRLPSVRMFRQLVRRTTTRRPA